MRAPSVRSLGISLTAVLCRLVEKDEYQGIARLGHCIATLARYFSGHAACVLRDYFAETVSLDGHLLSGIDLVIELDQMLDEPSLGCKDRERTVADKDTHVPACAPPVARPGCRDASGRSLCLPRTARSSRGSGRAQ